MENKFYKCVRCGACCISGCCHEGIETEDSVCKFLIINDDLTTSCKLVLKNKHKNISIGKGCVLQKSDEIYKYYLDRANDYKKYNNDLH